MTTIAHLGKGETTRNVIREDGMVLGVVSNDRTGWRFYPQYQRAPSCRGWPAPDAALHSYRIKLEPFVSLGHSIKMEG